METSKKIIKLKSKSHKFRKQHLKLFRDNQPLISVLQWGIKQSIEELSDVPMPPIFMPDDYKAHWKVKKVNQNFNAQGQPSQFKFKEYCPLVFKKLRQLFNYSDDKFLSLLTNSPPKVNYAQNLLFHSGNPNNPAQNMTNAQINQMAQDRLDSNEDDETDLTSNLTNQAHVVPPHSQVHSTTAAANISGALPGNSNFNEESQKINIDDENLYPKLPSLYYSHDYALILKFISFDNVAEMHNFLPKYYRHMVEQGPENSLLPRYLAMYRLSHSSSSSSDDQDSRHKEGKDQYVIIMENMFSKHLKVHKQYDLKGSTVGRSASNKEKERGVLFDKDFLNEKEQIILESADRNQFLEKLKSDVNFLADSKIISYSLLIGIHDTTRPNEGSNLNKNALRVEVNSAVH